MSATPPSPTAAPPPSYAQPPSQPPPPPPPSATYQPPTPRWQKWALGGIILVCAIILVTIVIILGTRLLGGRSDPTPTPTASPTPPPTITTVLTATATPAPAPSATVSPTVPAADAFQAYVTLTTSAAEAQPRGTLTVTVAISNTGQVTFGSLQYQLLGWEPAFSAPTGASAGHELDLLPGEGDTAIFLLEAAQAGTAQLYATVTVTTREDPPTVKPIASENVMDISVIQ